MDTCAQPHLVRLDHREDFFVCDGVHVTDDCERLSPFNEPRQKLPEQRKGRICDDDVGLIAQGPHFCRSKITITFKIIIVEVVKINPTIASPVAIKNKYL